MVVEAYTPGGLRLLQHATDKKMLSKLNEQRWDFVVLQEQSQYPAFSREQVSKEVFPPAKRLRKAVKRSHHNTEIVFYQTMAHRNGDVHNKEAFSELATYEGMQKRVNRTYTDMAKANHALLAPVGEIWKTIRKQKPKVGLYVDDVHPNVTGTYVAALTLYATIFESRCSGAAVPSSVDRETVDYLQGVVDEVVINSRRRWDWTR